MAGCSRSRTKPTPQHGGFDTQWESQAASQVPPDNRQNRALMQSRGSIRVEESVCFDSLIDASQNRVAVALVAITKNMIEVKVDAV